MAGKLRHVAYAGGWKKFEPVWDWVIRAKRVSGCLPLLEAVLAGSGDHLSRSGNDSRLALAGVDSRQLKEIEVV